MIGAFVTDDGDSACGARPPWPVVYDYLTAVIAVQLSLTDPGLGCERTKRTLTSLGTDTVSQRSALGLS